MATKVRRRKSARKRSPRRLNAMARRFRSAVSYCRKNRGNLPIQKCISRYLRRLGRRGRTRRKSRRRC